MNFEAYQQFHHTLMQRMQVIVSEVQWSNREVYIQWLANTLEYARQSTRILALTAGKLGPQHDQLSNRFIRHAAEEKNHDRLLLNDAKALGVSLEEWAPTHEAMAFHRSLYFHIFQGNPLEIMGWIMALEGFAISGAEKIFVQTSKSFGEASCRFIKLHCEEDVDHLEKAFSSISAFDNSEIALLASAQDYYSSLYIRSCLSCNSKILKFQKAA